MQYYILTSYPCLTSCPQHLLLFSPPLQFSKILLKWGGKQKSIVLLHFDVLPPNWVTKGVVMPFPYKILRVCLLIFECEINESAQFKNR